MILYSILIRLRRDPPESRVHLLFRSSPGGAGQVMYDFGDFPERAGEDIVRKGSVNRCKRERKVMWR